MCASGSIAEPFTGSIAGATGGAAQAQADAAVAGIMGSGGGLGAMSPLSQVRMSVGAFPGCAVYTGGRGRAANDVPLAPFGPLAVAPSCRWDGQ